MRPGLGVLVAFALVSSACASTATMAARELPPVTVVASTVDGQVTVNVLELFCQSCAEQIIAGCRHIPGVASVDVDRRQKLLTIHFDSSFTSREKVLAAVDDVVAQIP